MTTTTTDTPTRRDVTTARRIAATTTARAVQGSGPAVAPRTVHPVARLGGMGVGPSHPIGGMAGPVTLLEADEKCCDRCHLTMCWC